MKKKPIVQHLYFFVFLVLSINVLLVSCKDEYPYDNKEPEWLGASIYDYLVENGNYKNFVRLIEEVDNGKYKEILQKTGSKTLFVADDEAFKRFYQNNPWGVTDSSSLSMAQKKLIINFAMIDNAYLIETLSNYYDGTVHEGTALRRQTAVRITDSISFDIGDELPDGKFWTKYKSKGIHIVKDETPWSMVHFLQKAMDYLNITDEDFELITGKTRTRGDAYIFDDKVIERDITCKNGYINVLEDVLIPRDNMAGFIQKNDQTQIFAKFLARYCAPYYSAPLTIDYNSNHDEKDWIDSIFVKQFFTPAGTGDGVEYGGTNIYPDQTGILPELYLSFDPGWNSYHAVESNAGVALQADMAAMFVPTDDALEYYFNEGKGKILKDRFGEWDNVPDEVLVQFVRRHMKSSLLSALPSVFNLMRDENNAELPVKKADIVGSYVGVNGVVYLTNDVYPPDSYVSVYAPVLFNQDAKTKVMFWAIFHGEFDFYINSMKNRYSFFVPTDEYMKNYIDPFTIGKNIKGALKFRYNGITKTVNATVYEYDPTTGAVGDSVYNVTDEDFILDRLLDILDTHIVVGNVEDDQKFYLSKGGEVVICEGSGINLRVQGGDDYTKGNYCNVVEFYGQENGNTYFIDKPIQTPYQSVYKILSETPEFSEFFDLLDGFPLSSASKIFTVPSEPGIDYTVKFLNTFNYTVYVPTNEAIQNAIKNGVILNWDRDTIDGVVYDGILQIQDLDEQNAAIVKLERFLRYHFQDNSVFISGKSIEKKYQSATIKLDDSQSYFNTYKNKYYKIGVSGSGNDLTLTTETGATANVITNNGLYNILTRDYSFNNDPRNSREVDGSGTGTMYSASRITTSSTAVIHQIDNVLNFE